MFSASTVLLFAAFCVLGLCQSVEHEPKSPWECPPFNCGKLGLIKFPFTKNGKSPRCGLFTVDGCNDSDHEQKIQLEKGGRRWYTIENITQGGTIFIRDEDFQKKLNNKSCETFNNLTFSTSPLVTFRIPQHLSLLKRSCSFTIPGRNLSSQCGNYTVQSSIEYAPKSPSGPKPANLFQPNCSLIWLPALHPKLPDKPVIDIFSLLTANFSLEVTVLPPCISCHYRGGECTADIKGKFHCRKEGNRFSGWKLGLVIGAGVAVTVMILLLSILYRRRKRRIASTSSREDIESSCVYYGVPILSYKELEEATDNFDSAKELGEGGYGTVYYGKLRDGREVAVKRLYEHTCKRVQQFMNEVEILTRLRHKNLVSLYGCTSHSSRSLVLVYEYISNGTVADHLHGDYSKPYLLTWHIRMSIAIETATALAYLHASNIIHRDVKTNNILLDNNFGVKVADFGLSRLFPNDFTHVSTAPQGTPGYLDPEYYQCYQLTDKSDVYSFGVVLIELISSLPAVDISRSRHEINLANLAINKIQSNATDELIDPCLGYNIDEEVRRMAVSVAELALQCLQWDKEMRPSMKDVLEELKRIQGCKFEESQEIIASTSTSHSPEASLLKNTQQSLSRDSVSTKSIGSSMSS